MSTATSSQATSADSGGDLPVELVPCVDLTERARAALNNGAADATSPLEGDSNSDAALDALIRALCRRTVRHVLLTAEPGVSQGMVLSELARQLVGGSISGLTGRRILLLDCRYTAPEQSRHRLLGILSILGSDDETVVAIDGFAALLRGSQGTNKTILYATLSAVGCRLIGFMTPHEYEELFSDDPATRDFFSRIELVEPDIPTAKQIAGRMVEALERQYELAIEQAAVDRAVVLSANYILNERLPGKALRILTRVCEDLDYERSRGADIRTLSVDHVVRAVSDSCGVPEATLRGIADEADYERSLSEYIVGQEPAIRQIAGELGLIKSGLTDSNKPASVMLFVGQTGVGKTETAKMLARFYSSSKRLKTYTLGNFIESHSVSGIIGVPPGYVGHEQGGRLINDLNADPYGVFLLDEADKTHPDVLQPFLNLFDEGWIRDQRGVTAFADKSIFIMTTNVGQRMLADLARQGATPDEMAQKMKEALTKIRHTKSNRPVFTPEFLARIKRIVVFQPLTQTAMRGICQRMIAQMQTTWREKREKQLAVSDELVRHIADEAHAQNQKADGREGGRVVRRLIADLIETPLQKAIQKQAAEYRAGEQVLVEMLAAEEIASPQITVRFTKVLPS